MRWRKPMPRARATAGHEVRTLDVAQLDFPLLRSQHAWAHEPLPPALLPAQEAIRWADHMVFFFPLWLGGMPALLKGFLEQVAREGFAFAKDARSPMGAKLLKGRSARLVVTMGMPAVVYRYYFRAHSIKALERNILGFVGIGPIEETLIGLVEGMDDKAPRQVVREAARAGAAEPGSAAGGRRDLDHARGHSSSQALRYDSAPSRRAGPRLVEPSSCWSSASISKACWCPRSGSRLPSAPASLRSGAPRATSPTTTS